MTKNKHSIHFFLILEDCSYLNPQIQKWIWGPKVYADHLQECIKPAHNQQIILMCIYMICIHIRRGKRESEREREKAFHGFLGSEHLSSFLHRKQFILFLQPK